MRLQQGGRAATRYAAQQGNSGAKAMVQYAWGHWFGDACQRKVEHQVMLRPLCHICMAAAQREALLVLIALPLWLPPSSRHHTQQALLLLLLGVRQHVTLTGKSGGGPELSSAWSRLPSSSRRPGGPKAPPLPPRPPRPPRPLPLAASFAAAGDRYWTLVLQVIRLVVVLVTAAASVG